MAFRRSSEERSSSPEGIHKHTNLPRTTLEDIIGCVKYEGPTKTLDEMEAGIAEGARHVSRKMKPRQVSKPSRWSNLLGPVYTTGQVGKLLGGVPHQAIADRRDQRTLLGLKTADGVIVYPAFQFGERNEVLAGLPEVLQCFRDNGVDDWTLAAWLVSPSRALEGRSVVEWLHRGLDPEPVFHLAQDAARRFFR
jgi:hypothetical protein